MKISLSPSRFNFVIQHHFFSYIKATQQNPYQLQNALLTGQQFIDLLHSIELLIDALTFIGSIIDVILTSECRDVVQILGIDGREY